MTVFGMAGLPDFMNTTLNLAPKLLVVRQPQKRGYRFRYKSEGTKHGPIRGEVCSTDKGEEAYYPTIQLKNHTGPAKVLVSIVTDSEDVRADLHAHTLIVNKEATKGYYVYSMDGVDPVLPIDNLAIEHVVRDNIIDRLMNRILQTEFLNRFGWSSSVNNFGAQSYENLTSFTKALEDSDKMMDRETMKMIVGNKLDDLKQRAEKLNKTMAMNKCRLSFQVFLKGDNGHFSRRLDPVYSEVIFDGKTKHGAQLKIMRISKVTSSVNGDEEVWLIADKLNADDIEVRFYEDPKPGQSNVPWEAFGSFQKTDVYKQVCLVFRTPEYHDKQIAHSVMVNLELRRKSDHSRSEPQNFRYTSVLDRYGIGEKRKKELPMEEILGYAQSVGKRPCMPEILNMICQDQQIQNQYQNTSPLPSLFRPAVTLFNTQANTTNPIVSLGLSTYQILNSPTAITKTTINWNNTSNTTPVLSAGIITATTDNRNSSTALTGDSTVKEENEIESVEMTTSHDQKQAVENGNSTYFSNLLNPNTELSHSALTFINDIQSGVNG